MISQLRSWPTACRPIDAVAGRLPTSVSAAFALWMVALAAGLLETAMAVAAVAVGRDSSGWPAVLAQVTVRTVAFIALYLLARAMRRGTRWARPVLAAVFGVLGTFSLAVGPITWLAAGGSISAAYADADSWKLAFTASRLVHVLSVWGAVVCMFLPSANRFFSRTAKARRGTASSTASAGISVRGDD
jgi:hypothetical protein